MKSIDSCIGIEDATGPTEMLLEGNHKLEAQATARKDIVTRERNKPRNNNRQLYEKVPR